MTNRIPNDEYEFLWSNTFEYVRIRFFGRIFLSNKFFVDFFYSESFETRFGDVLQVKNCENLTKNCEKIVKISRKFANAVEYV